MYSNVPIRDEQGIGKIVLKERKTQHANIEANVTFVKLTANMNKEMPPFYAKSLLCSRQNCDDFVHQSCTSLNATVS